MRRRWILVGLAVGLLVAAITGGAVLAWGGPGHGWGRGHDDDGLSALASKVADILGTDEQETSDAIAQARGELRDEAYDVALTDVADRVAETLGTDAAATAEAIEKVSKEMFDEALEEKLQNAIDDGRMTEERAQEYRDKADSGGGWYGFGYGFKRGDSEEFADRVGEELDVDGGDVKGALEQALADIRTEALEERLEGAVDSGRLTQDEADEILEDYEPGDGHGFYKKGRGGFGSGWRHGRGRWHHSRHGSGGDATATPTPTTEGDST